MESSAVFSALTAGGFLADDCVRLTAVRRKLELLTAALSSHSVTAERLVPSHVAIKFYKNTQKNALDFSLIAFLSH